MMHIVRIHRKSFAWESYNRWRYEMADVLTKEQRHKNMPGNPDIVLTKYKIAIFCDGEFFHGKDWEVLKPRLEKSNNSEFWISKISRNRERDDEINKRLLFEGWTVIRFWGDDIKKHTDECVRVVEETIFETDVGVQEMYEIE